MKAQVLDRRKQAKKLPCLDGSSSNCQGIFMTTKEVRICYYCTLNKAREVDAPRERKEDRAFIDFWRMLR